MSPQTMQFNGLETIHKNQEVEKNNPDTDVEALKSSILANVSHELRTPITIIKLIVDLFEQESFHNKEEKCHLLKTARKAMGRLNSTVEDLILASQMQVNDIELIFNELDIAEIILHAVEGLKDVSAQKKIFLSTDLSPGIPKVKSNKNAMIKVLTSILENSIKFMSGEGGTVHIGARKEKGFIVFSIKDDGIGIPPIFINEIFNPFYQVDSSPSRTYGGTGMGLSVAKSIVDRLGGSIWAESAFGSGTNIYFTVPAAGE